MKAIVQERFGPPDILQLVDADSPEAGADDVLVRVHAAALNPYDWHIMRGRGPYTSRSRTVTAGEAASTRVPAQLDDARASTGCGGRGSRNGCPSFLPSCKS
jgi:NADPH:quinone reductase-like Zn-dependent oxidoreductase